MKIFIYHIPTGQAFTIVLTQAQYDLVEGRPHTEIIDVPFVAREIRRRLGDTPHFMDLQTTVHAELGAPLDAPTLNKFAVTVEDCRVQHCKCGDGNYDGVDEDGEEIEIQPQLGVVDEDGFVSCMECGASFNKRPVALDQDGCRLSDNDGLDALSFLNEKRTVSELDFTKEELVILHQAISRFVDQDEKTVEEGGYDGRMANLSLSDATELLARFDKWRFGKDA